MIRSALATRTVTTPNQGPRTVPIIDRIVLHHMASTGIEGVLASWHSGAKQGSAHYAIGNEGQIVSVVPEELRAWSLSSVSFDSRSIVVEIENEAMGGAWPVSAKAHEATERLVADICRRLGLPINRNTIIGHSEVFTQYGKGYATACPGGLKLDAVAAGARAFNAPKPTPTPTPITPDRKEDLEMGFYIKAPDGSIYWITQATGTKRHVAPAEWRILLAAERAKAATVTVVSVSKADADAIPG